MVWWKYKEFHNRIRKLFSPIEGGGVGSNNKGDIKLPQPYQLVISEKSTIVQGPRPSRELSPPSFQCNASSQNQLSTINIDTLSKHVIHSNSMSDIFLYLIYSQTLKSLPHLFM